MTSAPTTSPKHVNTETKKRNHVRQLETLGYRVTLESAA